MPKGKRKAQAPTRPPSLRGAIVIDDYIGKPRVRAWPSPRPGTRHPTNVQWTDWLKGVTFLWRYQPARFRFLLERATKGTPWMARDPFISGARGRAWSITFDNGIRYFPVPVKAAVSQSLDAIGQFSGNMLFRLANGWERVEPPPDEGYVLTSNLPGQLPTWEAPQVNPGVYEAWSPISPPTVPNTDDDEFSTLGSGVPAGWAAWNHGSNTTYAVDAGGFIASQPSHAGNAWGGIYKAIPSGDVTLWTRLGVNGTRANLLHTGLALLENPTSSTGDLYTISLSFTASAPVLGVARWNAYNAFNSNLVGTVGLGVDRTHSFVAAARTGSTWTFWISADGLNWERFFAGSLAFTPTHWGIAIDNAGTTVDAAVRASFARVLNENKGVTTLLPGRRVD